MLYIQRNEYGELTRVEASDFAGSTGTLPADDHDVQAWYANHSVESNLLQLKHSDLEMIRVIDDLISVLMNKGVLRITDLPPAAQSKLLSRTQNREALGGLHKLINDDDSGVI